jgi:hypothetical protein
LTKGVSGTVNKAERIGMKFAVKYCHAEEAHILEVAERNKFTV